MLPFLLSLVKFLGVEIAGDERRDGDGQSKSY
jgi:hypothetical protein